MHPLERIRSYLRESDYITVLLWATIIGAIIVRSVPAWMNAAWGSDYGIYYGITDDFLKHPQLFRPYSGWGTSYVYFPVLYIVTAMFQGITGLGLDFLMPRVAPIFGGLTVPLLYLIVKEILGNRKVALAAAAFLTADPFQLYITSHAAPMTMGHFFMCLTILFFIKYRKNRFWTGPLYVSTILLIASHHLTTYFYILFIFILLIYRNLQSKEWTPNLKEDLFYFIMTVTITFAYWILIATPVFRGDFESAVHMNPWIVVVAFYAIILSIFFVLPRLRKQSWFQRIVAYKPSWPTPKEDLAKVGVTVTCGVAFTLFFALHNIYDTTFIFLPSSVLYLLPLFIILGLCITGYRYLDRFPDRAYIKAWLMSIGISFIFAVITRNQAIYSFRHLEYFSYPFSVMAGVAVWEMRRYLKKENLRKVFTVAVGALVVASAATAFSVQSSTSGFEESISSEAMDAVGWMKDNLPHNCTVASDHRLSQIAWMRGFNATSDDAYIIWFCINWTDAIKELNATGKKYERVSYVLIDDIMRDRGIQSNNNETPRPMTNESYEKFALEPFSLIHREVSQDGKKWAEVYSVNWTYIEAQGNWR